MMITASITTAGTFIFHGSRTEIPPWNFFTLHDAKLVAKWHKRW